MHLSFVNDLMLFSIGDGKSISILYKGLDLFAQSSSLHHANDSKSTIYFAGISHAQQQYILDGVNIMKGDLPFRYLGVPINSCSLTIADSEHLVEKMTSRIRGWQRKKLSYAAKLQLANSVLMSISSYWC